MRARWSWSLVVGLAVSVAGCTKHETTTYRAAQAIPPGTHIEKETDLPPRAPKAMTCVSAGQCIEDMADQPLGLDNPSQVAFLRQQRYEQARRQYQRALEIDPNNIEAALGVARVYGKEGNHGLASSNYGEAVRKHPQCASLWFEFGMCMGRQKQWPQAVECLEKAAGLDPQNMVFSSHLGWALARSGRFEESLAHFTRTVGPARAHYNLALMTKHLGQTEVSRQFVLTGLQHDPQSAECRELLLKLDAVTGDAVQQVEAPVGQGQP